MITPEIMNKVDIKNVTKYEQKTLNFEGKF